ncbi:hypothetical protein [Microbacterium sp. Se5.02b]|uniref:hypothetical protein n=1 Tax=Microbacterium sp. Se5.02b TaxID=2864103 RepID=UPI001C688F84|nr:hypothetical protein [Microbacterium sp. Se5.02b]QYM63718.1 hypothetical protein K1X59_16355 [Microbacterium sp. Se5.02b]
MTIPTAPPPPADHAAPATGTAGTGIPRGAERFLLWVAGLGVARTEGWLGVWRQASPHDCGSTR